MAPRAMLRTAADLSCWYALSCVACSNKPERSLQAGGWEEPLVAFLGDERASYDLWPSKPKPRWWPSLLPRVWLMTATARAARE